MYVSIGLVRLHSCLYPAPDILSNSIEQARRWEISFETKPALEKMQKYCDTWQYSFISQWDLTGLYRIEPEPIFRRSLNKSLILNRSAVLYIVDKDTHFSAATSLNYTLESDGQSIGCSCLTLVKTCLPSYIE